MHAKKQFTKRPRRAPLVVAAISLACLVAGVSAQVSAEPAAPTLKSLFDAAWARQPQAQALQARREAVAAQRRAVSSWTPDPPSLLASHKTDRLTHNDGARELEVGIAVPLWLPGERRAASALTDAEAAAVDSKVEAERLRLAATVRETWWNWQRTAIDVDIAREQLDSARRIASDVARRVKAGELARADQHQADSAAAAAEAALAQAQAAATVALQQLKALSGASTLTVPAVSAAAEPEPAASGGEAHPSLAELQDRVAVALHAAALAAIQSRANPELTLTATRDRGAFGERYGQSVTVALRIPLGGGPRHEAKAASARAEAAEVQAQLALDRARLQAEGEAAVARVEAARTQLAAAERRAALARESRGFFEKSFRLGETDLPTLLRIVAEATEAERQAARSRIELAAAISGWRQALGLLPQ